MKFSFFVLYAIYANCLLKYVKWSNSSKIFCRIVCKTLGTVNKKVGLNKLISSIKVVLTEPEMKPILAATPMNPLMTIRSKIWANGKKLICAPCSSSGTHESLITVSKTHLIFLWVNITPFGFPVVPLV